MARWRASCSGSPAASRPTRRASSCGCSSGPGTTCCRCRRAAPSGSSRAETFFALARKAQSDDPYPHLERADLLVVAPLTANTLAKLAHGLADDVLTEAALAHRGPVLVAPAMNTRMWEHPATQANAATLAGARRRADRAGGGRARRGRGRARPDGRAGGDRRARSRRCSAQRRRRRVRSRARTCSSPPAARASRSTPSASSATARRAGWASRSPRRRSAAARR